MTRTIQQLFDLTGKTALVTGSASGAGLQLAHALGEAGARIMLNGRHADALELATAELQDAGIDARWIAADCSQASGCQRLADQTLQRMGDVDILVNTPGADWGEPATEVALTDWEQGMSRILHSYASLSRIIVRQSMMARRSGRIINLALHAGVGASQPAMSTLAKHTLTGGLIHFTQALAAEWGPYNITVNAICPAAGAGTRSFGTRVLPGEASQTGYVQLPHAAEGEDLKGPCLLFASEAGQYLSGQWLVVAGGVDGVCDV